MIELSNRLRAVAGLVAPGGRAADVGCDHGYVSIWLVEQGISSHVIAMDVNQGPLSRATEHIAAYGLSQYIETRLSDGVEALQTGEADSLILAGMGARLMLRILEDGHSVTGVMKEWILQPQSEIALFRRSLRRMGAEIVEEDMVEEDGKFYPILKARPSGNQTAGPKDGLWQEACDSYGPRLLLQRHPVLRRYLTWEEQKDARIVQELTESPASKAQKKIAGKAALLPKAPQTGADRRHEKLAQLEHRRQVRDRALSCYEADAARHMSCTVEGQTNEMQ